MDVDRVITYLLQIYCFEGLPNDNLIPKNLQYRSFKLWTKKIERNSIARVLIILANNFINEIRHTKLFNQNFVTPIFNHSPLLFFNS